MFTDFFGCTIDERKHKIKVIPPPVDEGLWFWPRTPFFVCKVRIRITLSGYSKSSRRNAQPADNWLGHQDMYRYVVYIVSNIFIQ